MTSCPPNFRVWPEFHNGVAAGLRLPMSSKGSGKQIITRTWIKFNKPVTNQQQDSGSNNNQGSSGPSYAHGGFLMALYVYTLMFVVTIKCHLTLTLFFFMNFSGLRGYL